MLFGERLSAVRKERGFSQLYLAGKMQTTQRHLSFLETGRSTPSREMLFRICEALDLDPALRTDLFEAIGLVSPYKTRNFSDAEVIAALQVIENNILSVWPYPGYALTPDWDILLSNKIGAELLGTDTETIKANRPNFFDIVLSSGFKERILNWDEVAAAFYARLKRHAVKFPHFQGRIDAAVEAGLMPADFEALASKSEIPALLPMEFRMPDGNITRITSLAAHFSSVHDEIMAGIEIELMVPVG